MNNVTNRAYSAYDRMTRGFESSHINLGFNHPDNKQLVGGIVWMAQINAPNPFPSGSDAAQLYFRMCHCYKLWVRGDVDCRVNRIRMLQAGCALAQLKIPNPFKNEVEREHQVQEVSLEALAEAELRNTLAEDMNSGTFVPATDVTRIFGVVPEGDE